MSTDFKAEDWISQAEAARRRGVSRQAIAKLVKNHRIRTLAVGGHVLVNRRDLESYKPKKSGRPKNVK